MTVQVLRFAALLYAGAAVMYLFFFARPRHVRAASTGAVLLSLGFVVHAVSIGLGCREYGGTEFFGLRGGFVTLAWLMAGAYLLLQRRYHIPAVGAFITPLILFVIIPFVLPPHRAGVDRASFIELLQKEPFLPLHVMTAMLGIALFAIAFGVAVMYLLQEREVKGKHFGALFSRLPSLESLDRLNQWLVRLGFVIFGIALVTGAVVARGVWKSFWGLDPQAVMSLVVWLLYGALVLMRHNGWHGRRYAVITMIGFLIVIGSMVSLQTLPGVTRHAGDFQTSQGVAQ